MNYFSYDIKKHNYIQFSSFQPKATPGFWRLLWRKWKNWWKYGRKVSNVELPKTKAVLFVSTTQNNKRALEPIWKNLPEDSYTAITRENINEFMPNALVAKYSFRYLIPLLKAYISSTKHEKAIIRSYFDFFFSVMGDLKLVERLLKNNPISLVVMANDHSPIQRSFIAVAKELGTKTLYVQHCSVTERFPELKFTYSLLDGEESFEKYAKIGGMEGTVYLCGNPRFDYIRTLSGKKEALKRIGIALNLNDNMERVFELCAVLKENGFEDIVIRPHPRHNIDLGKFEENGFEISDSKKENPFEFLIHINYLIAGESGIHLDAAMMETPSVCYAFSDDRSTFDWYSYIKNGLMPFTENPAEVVEIIKKTWGEDAGRRIDFLRWYNASLGTPQDGHIGELVADFIVHQQKDRIEDFDEKYNFKKTRLLDKEVKVYNC